MKMVGGNLRISTKGILEMSKKDVVGVGSVPRYSTATREILKKMQVVH